MIVLQHYRNAFLDVFFVLFMVIHYSFMFSFLTNVFFRVDDTTHTAAVVATEELENQATNGQPKADELVFDEKQASNKPGRVAIAVWVHLASVTFVITTMLPVLSFYTFRIPILTLTIVSMLWLTAERYWIRDSGKSFNNFFLKLGEFICLNARVTKFLD